MPVDLYIGGAEHAVGHLLYARFWHKVLYDCGVVSTKEPFQRLINQGMITSFAFQRKNKTLVPVDEVEEKDGKHFEKATGEELEQIVATMSKSTKCSWDLLQCLNLGQHRESSVFTASLKKSGQFQKNQWQTLIFQESLKTKH